MGVQVTNLNPQWVNGSEYLWRRSSEGGFGLRWSLRLMRKHAIPEWLGGVGRGYVLFGTFDVQKASVKFVLCEVRGAG